MPYVFYNKPCVFFHVGIYMFFCRIRVGEDSCEMQTTGGCVCRRKGLSLNLKVSGLLI